LRGDEGDQIAERLRVAVEEARPADSAVTMSFGVASSDGDLGSQGDPERVMKVADRRMYLAKERGRNLVVGSSPDGRVPAYAGGSSRAA
jgi:GGDEF domain-containing protein